MINTILNQTQYDIHRVFLGVTFLATHAWLRPVSRENRHFTVGGGILRQSGPRPETISLRSACTRRLKDFIANGFSSKSFPEQVRRTAEAAVCTGGGVRSKSTLSRLNDGFGSAQRSRVQTDEHSVHPHHYDFVITPIADQIGPIDSVSKTEYYDLKNHFSEPQCKMTVLPLNSGNLDLTTVDF
ncbi:desmoplakin [Dorcoceras hygrometricum]|uniref:Desmoplakin n=1 Tax=Dorcoceras hygrometricum TaxID=472368 RepID=A0A2Z7AZ00_9LAMI|nr:desmoplakin [Dorcoceras hygrometricum]